MHVASCQHLISGPFKCPVSCTQITWCQEALYCTGALGIMATSFSWFKNSIALILQTVHINCFQGQLFSMGVSCWCSAQALFNNSDERPKWEYKQPISKSIWLLRACLMTAKRLRWQSDACKKWTASEKTYVYHFLVLCFSAANHLNSVCLGKEMSHSSKTKW